MRKNGLILLSPRVFTLLCSREGSTQGETHFTYGAAYIFGSNIRVIRICWIKDVTIEVEAVL